MDIAFFMLENQCYTAIYFARIARRPTLMSHSSLSHSTLPGGLDIITLANKHGQISISPFGAQLLSYKNAQGKERLWLSERAITDGSAAIRGGVPCVLALVWPASNRPQRAATRLGQNHAVVVSVTS